MLISIIVLASLIGVAFGVAKYTSWGMPYRISRLHDQIETRNDSLQQTYETKEAQGILLEELRQNRLIRSAFFSGDKLELCYVDETCEEFYVGIED